jgi:hypothetical protein
MATLVSSCRGAVNGRANCALRRLSQESMNWPQSQHQSVLLKNLLDHLTN